MATMYEVQVEREDGTFVPLRCGQEVVRCDSMAQATMIGLAHEAAVPRTRVRGDVAFAGVAEAVAEETDAARVA